MLNFTKELEKIFAQRSEGQRTGSARSQQSINYPFLPMSSTSEPTFPTTEHYQKLRAGVEALENEPCFNVVADLVQWIFSLQKSLDRATADIRLLNGSTRGKDIKTDYSSPTTPHPSSTENNANNYHGSSTLPPPSSTGYEYYYITLRDRNSSPENTTYNMHMLPLDGDTVSSLTLEGNSFFALNEYQLTALQNLLSERNSRTAVDGHWVLSGLRLMGEAFAVVIRFSGYAELENYEHEGLSTPEEGSKNAVGRTQDEEDLDTLGSGKGKQPVRPMGANSPPPTESGAEDTDSEHTSESSSRGYYRRGKSFFDNTASENLSRYLASEYFASGNESKPSTASLNVSTTSRFPNLDESLARGGMTKQEVDTLSANDPIFAAMYAEYQRELRTQWKTQGPDHKETLEIMKVLAELYHGRGKIQATEMMYREVYERTMKTLGEDHEEMAEAKFNLARACQIQGRLDEASILFEGVMKCSQNSLGQEFPAILAAEAKRNLQAIRTLRGL